MANLIEIQNNAVPLFFFLFFDASQTIGYTGRDEFGPVFSLQKIEKDL